VKRRQNVNKVSSKAQLSYDIARCSFLNAEQKEQLFNALDNKINKDGELAYRPRTQVETFPKINKLVRRNFIALLTDALTPVKERKVGIPKKIDTSLPDDEQEKQRKLKKTIGIAKHKAKLIRYSTKTRKNES
jgi:hypothetical protein